VPTEGRQDCICLEGGIALDKKITLITDLHCRSSPPILTQM